MTKIVIKNVDEVADCVVNKLVSFLDEVIDSFELKDLFKDSEENNEEEKVEDETPTLEYFINCIAEKKHWSYDKTIGWMKSIYDLYPTALFNILIREIALWCDLKYPDHISKSKEIYCVSMSNGNIFRANKESITSYKNFAAFRTYEDAKLACDILKNPLIDLFGGEQED